MSRHMKKQEMHLPEWTGGRRTGRRRTGGQVDEGMNMTYMSGILTVHSKTLMVAFRR